jgi:hypothetical protein
VSESVGLTGAGFRDILGATQGGDRAARKTESVMTDYPLFTRSAFGMRRACKPLSKKPDQGSG